MRTALRTFGIIATFSQGWLALCFVSVCLKTSVVRCRAGGLLSVADNWSQLSHCACRTIVRKRSRWLVVALCERLAISYLAPQWCLGIVSLERKISFRHRCMFQCLRREVTGKAVVVVCCILLFSCRACVCDFGQVGFGKCILTRSLKLVVNFRNLIPTA